MACTGIAIFEPRGFGESDALNAMILGRWMRYPWHEGVGRAQLTGIDDVDILGKLRSETETVLWLDVQEGSQRFQLMI